VFLAAAFDNGGPSELSRATGDQKKQRNERLQASGADPKRKDRDGRACGPVGIAGGGSAIAFREAISAAQLLFYGEWSERLASHARSLPWWHILAATTLGGLAVGILVHLVMPGRRPQGVADVIEASALRGGRMSASAGLVAAVVSAVSLGAGASTGREGPVVHLGATLSALAASRLRLGRSMAQTLLGCGVAAAVAASFNAPIAGVFFALEVVVGSYALATFAPIVVASVTGTIISRMYFGDFPAFVLPSHQIASFLEFPAFAFLGVLSAAVAVALVWSVGVVQDRLQDWRIPAWLQPGLGGLAVGGIAVYFPEVLGVGYEATDTALREGYPFLILVALLVAKVFATVISLGCGFGGGVFSPSLFVGAMLGGSFGLVATYVLPDLSSGHGAYTIVGMGAVAGAVLGAPISTILMIFELTGDYSLTIAVMVATVISSQVMSHYYADSFFVWQLSRRRISLKGGRESRALRSARVGDTMKQDFLTVRPDATLAEIRAQLQRSRYAELFVVDDERQLCGTITLTDLAENAFDTSHDDELLAKDVQRRNPPALTVDDTLDQAVRLMDGAGEEHIAVMDSVKAHHMVGVLHQRDVMQTYHRAILEARPEDDEAAPSKRTSGTNSPDAS